MRKLIIFLCAALGSFTGSGQVNLQTGSAVFSFPMFNWHDNKSRLGAQIQLNYCSGNGLLVDEVASNIGQGWNLMAGGVITRLQVGQPDDQKPRDGNYNDIKKYPPGYLYNPTAIAAGCPKALANYPIFSQANTLYKQNNLVDADRELDYFSFQFNGHQGLFILGKDNGDIGISLGDSKLKISFIRNESIPNTRTVIDAFKIQDENGLIYTFRDKGVTKVTRVSYSNASGIPIDGVPNFSDQSVYYQTDVDDLGLDENPYVVGSWYLSEVEDPLNHRKISYTYSIFNINTPAGQTMELIQPYGVASTRYITISYKHSIAQKPALTAISYPDGHDVSFTYGAGRKDVLGDKCLTNVQVNYQGRPLSRYDLNQSYFMRNAIATPETYSDGLTARLCLVSVTRRGVDLKAKENPYRFDYNLGSNATEDCVPSLFSPIKDIWGYYNGDISGVPTNSFIDGYNQFVLLFYHPLPGTLPGNDQSLHPKVKPGYAKNGLLQKITYPMGGTLSYQYDQNKAPGSAGIGDYYGGVHVSGTTMSDGVNTAGDIVTSYNYALEDHTTTSIWGVETPLCRLKPTTYFKPENNHAVLGVPPCDYTYKYAGILARAEAVNPSDLQQFMVVFSQVLGYAGIGMDVFMLVTTQNPAFLVFDIVAGIVDCVSDKTYLWDHTVDFNYNLLSVNPLPAQYKRVEVRRGGADRNIGMTVYNFTSPDDYAIVAPDVSGTYSSRQRLAIWAYGLPKTVTILDSLGKKVHETENLYDFSKARTVVDPAHSSSCKCFTINRSSKNSDTWMSSTYINDFSTETVTNMTSDPAIKDQLLVEPYTMFTGRTELTATYERYFKDDNNQLEKAIFFEYSPNNYQVSKTTTTLTNGDKAIKEVYYTADYAGPGILQTLTNNNIVNTPVAAYNSVIKNGTSTPTYLGATVTDFMTLSNGDIKPSRKLVGRSAAPMGAYSFDPTNAFNYPALIQEQGYAYDGTGDMVNTTDEGGRTLDLLYNHNDRFVVASAVNAAPGEIAYTSFETDNNNGWVINPKGGSDPIYNSAGTVTGARSLNLGSVTSISTSLNIGKAYLLTFWTDGSSVSVSGNATLKKSGPTVNGFTYYEYVVTAGSAAPVLSGSGNIDELRLYPAGARLTTSTFDDLLGKTSDCDPGSRITLYEYDGFGRIHIVRDENRNIIKLYEYNSKQ